MDYCMYLWSILGIFSYAFCENRELLISYRQAIGFFAVVEKDCAFLLSSLIFVIAY